MEELPIQFIYLDSLFLMPLGTAFSIGIYGLMTRHCKSGELATRMSLLEGSSTIADMVGKALADQLCNAVGYYRLMPRAEQSLFLLSSI
jgi:hypothetical protein